MRKQPKEIEVIEHAPGTKTVARKTSWVKKVKRVFWIISIIWLTFVAIAPLYIKSHYASPIKKSIVVSVFFDLQRNIVDQYEKLLDGIKKSIDLEKPVAIAISQVKMAEGAVNKVVDTTAKAKDTTKAASATTGSVKSLTGLAGKFGVNTTAVDNAVAQADKGIAGANAAVAKVDNTAAMVNAQLDKAEKKLVEISQTEVDKMVDEAIKHQLDKNSGGLGTTLLTNYGIHHVYPWRPSSWPTAVKIYNDLEKSNVGVVNIITNTVNKYFGYVMWGIVAAMWIAGLFVWMQIFKKVKALTAPFIVCPRCGHTFADKRTAYSLLKALKPWTWL
ncbi:MAG: hypothetical protein LBJ18_01255 [Rickettsiales bacterium]|jgi:hypothetical protein|nr:hypothetical protein [Rickettsiales bacterium]